MFRKTISDEEPSAFILLVVLFVLSANIIFGFSHINNEHTLKKKKNTTKHSNAFFVNTIGSK